MMPFLLRSTRALCALALVLGATSAHAQADLALAMSATPSSPTLGNTVTVTVALSNTSNRHANDVVVTAALPAGLSYQSVSGASYNAATGALSFGRVNKNKTDTATLTVVPTAAGVHVISGAITGSSEPDPNSSNNTASAQVSAIAPTPSGAGVTLRETFEGTVGYAATAGTFRTASNAVDACSVANTSSAALAGIPAGATVETAVLYWAGSGSTPDGQVTFDGTTINDLTPTTATYNVSATEAVRFFQGAADVTSIVAAKGNGTYSLADLIVEFADDTASSPQEPYCSLAGVLKAWSLLVVYNDPAMTQRSRINLYDGFDLQYGTSLTTTIDQFETTGGDLATFTYVAWEGDPDQGTGEAISLTPGGASTITLDDTDPFNSTPHGFDGTEGARLYSVDLDAYDLTGLLPVGTTSADLTLQTSAGDLVILSSAVLQVPSLASDLAVALSASNAAPNYESETTLYVDVTNNGPNPSDVVTVAVAIPAGYSYVADAAPAGTSYDAASGTWTLPAGLAVGETARLPITLMTETEDPADVTATATAQARVDEDLSDNAAALTLDGVPAVVDLALDLTVSDPAPTVGDEVTFTLTVTNESVSTATGLIVSSPFVTRADTVAVLGATPTAGAYDGTFWTIGTLAPGASETLTVTVRLDQDLIAFTALAEVAAVDQADVDSTPFDGSTDQDDDTAATATTGGASTAGEGGLESNGSMAQALARVLYGRRQAAALRAESGLVAAPLRPMAQARLGAPSALALAVPTVGPAGSAAVEVSPTDLLPVTNATDVVAADYLRPDGRRVGALFATATAPGEVYEHTKPVCDRLRGGRLDGLELVTVAGHPFVLTRLTQADGSVDYAVSFVVYDGEGGRTVDSRFLLSDYDTAAMAGGDVLNFQVWGPSREYAAALVAGALAEVSGGGPLAFRNGGETAPTLPAVFVRSGHYDAGRLVLELYNAAGATSLTLSGGTLTRAEGAAPTAFSRTVDVPAGSPEAPLVTVAVETGPLFDAAFFVETEASTAPDRLYLADGTWGVALDPTSATARLDAFDVAPEAGDVLAGARRVERSARVAGRTDSWATLYRTLAPGGLTADLSGYSYVEFEASGSGEARLMLQQAAIRTSDHYGATVRLTATPARHRVYFEDLQLADGSRGFDGRGVVTLSLTTWTGGDAAFEMAVSDVRFGGAAGDLAAAPDEPALLAPAPNPFSRSTRVRFDLAEAGRATLRVFDVLGREVARPVDGERPAGRHTVVVDGSGLAAGVYVVRLDAGGRTLTQRVTLTR